MSKMPVVSGRQAIRAFVRAGYVVVRQRGSHVRLRDEINPDHLSLTIPDHKELKPGILRKLLRDSGMSVDEFASLLKDV